MCPRMHSLLFNRHCAASQKGGSGSKPSASSPSRSCTSLHHNSHLIIWERLVPYRNGEVITHNLLSITSHTHFSNSCACTGLLESCRSEVIKGDKSVAYTHGLFTRPLFLQEDPGESHRGGVQRGKSVKGNCLRRGQKVLAFLEILIDHHLGFI